MKYSVIRPTPRSKRYIICDVCGIKYHIHEVVKVQDKYNRQCGLIVCKRCKDPTNPQDRPLVLKEKITGSLDKMRPRSQTVFTLNDNDSRVPGKPNNGIAQLDPIADNISLYWDAPTDQGSSNIQGYVVQRFTEPSGTWATIAVTDNGIAYYLDLTADITIPYGYRVAAYNGFGTGAYSDIFYWLNVDYFLIDAATSAYIVTEIGDYITVEGL